MWLLAEFESVTLFTLKMSAATSSGGKTLLVPTPYAIKMALLDADCRLSGLRQAQAHWPALRDLQVALLPARKVVVTNLFQKILKPYKRPPKADDPEYGPFQRTIGYREYVQMVGAWGLGIGFADAGQLPWLRQLLTQLNYLGRRGGFIQLLDLPAPAEMLHTGYISLVEEQKAFALGTLQLLDDCAGHVSFDQVNIYSTARLVNDKDRIVRQIILPYRMTRASKSFTLYERVG